MSVESQIFTRASGFAGLTALISTRIYPGIMPQAGTMPAVSYARIAAERALTMGTNPGLVRARFQFDVWSKNYDQSRSIAEQVRLAFERWNTTTGTIVQDTYLESEVEIYENETQTHHVALDFIVIYEE